VIAMIFSIITPVSHYLSEIIPILMIWIITISVENSSAD